MISQVVVLWVMLPTKGWHVERGSKSFLETIVFYVIKATIADFSIVLFGRWFHSQLHTILNTTMYKLSVWMP